MNIQELERMPLSFLRNVDIRTREEEEMVQKVVNAKLAAQPVPIAQPQFLSSETDNLTVEKEKELQAQIDARNEENRKKLQGTQEVVMEKLVVEPKKFCEFCTSKGVKHKKDCTRNIAV